MEINIIQEILFALGILLFTASLVFVGVIMRLLLRMIHSESFMWVLPLIASFFVLIFGLFHFHTTISYIKPQITPREYELIRQYFKIQFFGSIALFISGLLALIASASYFWKTTH